MQLNLKSLEGKSIVSKVAGLLIISLLFSIALYIISQGFSQRYFKYDAWGYYIYLPSFFIYHDALTMQHAAAAMWRYDLSHEFYQATRLDNGNFVFGYTGGVAIMQSPFFFTAHAIATLLKLTADGYSPIYQFFIICSGFFWGLWGVTNCYSIVRKYFNDNIGLITCVVIVFATNLYNYMFWENGMTHVYSFFLISLCLKNCFDFFDTPSYRKAIAIGLALGLIILIRPTNAIICLPLFFIAIGFRMSDISSKVIFCKKHFVLIIIIALLSVLPFAAQTLYWKWSTGIFLFNPYAHLGFRFDFVHPHIFFGLFSVQKGWFFYTPVLLLIIPGLTILAKSKGLIPSAVILIYLMLHIWIAYSWQVFDYGSSFGARPMVDIYALLCIPLAFTIEWAFRHIWVRPLAILFLILCTANNIFHTWKFDKGYLSGVGYSPKEVLANYFDYDDLNVHLSGAEAASLTIENELVNTNKQIVAENASFSEMLCFTFDSIRGNYKDHFARVEITGMYPGLDILKGMKNASVVISQDRHNDFYSWKSIPVYAQTATGDTSLQKIVFEKKLVRPFGKEDMVRAFVVDGSSNKFELHSIKFDIIKK